jgi:hypothetical protein
VKGYDNSVIPRASASPFLEKTAAEHIFSHHINAGIYVFGPEVSTTFLTTGPLISVATYFEASRAPERRFMPSLKTAVS